MLGRMQDWPLLISKLIEHAEREHGAREIVSALVEGGVHRTSWSEVALRSRKLAQALTRLGMQSGDRVATLAWNTHRHVEAWFAIAGMGAVYHTINPRLFPEQIVYIANHAEDRVLMFDITFAPLVEKLAAMMPTITTYIALCDRSHLPAGLDLPNLLTYEEFIGPETGDYSWPVLDENTPCGLCYTSGTTGNPKGVLYSHRSNVLHMFFSCMADAMGISTRSVIMPVVPMFHANAWGVPFSAAAVGAKLVLNGPHFDPGSLHKMIIEEGVTYTAAVPTVWLGMLQYLEKTGQDLGALKAVTIGGSAAPRMMIDAFQTKYGVQVSHAWGMTELSPLGTVGTLKADTDALTADQQLDLQCKQGRSLFGVEMKISDDDGRTLPRDGKIFGHLKVRGPAVVAEYFKADGGNVLDQDGFFDTGDIATIDPHGYMQITDRSKDVIKSGGEWISSIDLENAAVAHPAVQEAAVIGVAHPKWDERPLLLLVLHPEASITREEMIEFLTPRVAKWWLPDDVVVVPDLPHTATGKLLKTALREKFKNYRLPTAA